MFELQDGVLHIHSFLAFTCGIVVLFLGKRLNDAFGFLREFSIPEPVTGGLLVSVLFGLLYFATDIAVEFDLAARDLLLVYFFTTIGINASLSDLKAGGKPLVFLLAITIAFMFAQNLTGISIANLFDLPGCGRHARRYRFADWRPWHGNRLGTADRRGVQHRQRDGDRHRLCHLRTDPGQPPGRADRQVPDHPLRPQADGGRTLWTSA